MKKEMKRVGEEREEKTKDKKTYHNEEILKKRSSIESINTP